MPRPSTLRFLFVPALILALAFVVAACGGGEEKTFLVKYFNASKMGDNMTLANIATVGFDPARDGQMGTFSILSSTEDKVTELELKRHAADLKALQDQEAEFSKRKKEYQDANGEAIDRVLKAEAKGQSVRGRDAEVQAEWAKLREQTAEWAGKISEARNTLRREQPVVVISTLDARNPVDVLAYDGTLTVREVTIEGNVTKDGQTSKKKYVVTIERATLKGVHDGQDLVGRWVVTGIKPL
ncbi:MAG: hypothetical protein AB1806_02705 [Acidobacteriota bacterium]